MLKMKNSFFFYYCKNCFYPYFLEAKKYLDKPHLRYEFFVFDPDQSGRDYLVRSNLKSRLDMAQKRKIHTSDVVCPNTFFLQKVGVEAVSAIGEKVLFFILSTF